MMALTPPGGRSELQRSVEHTDQNTSPDGMKVGATSASSSSKTPSLLKGTLAAAARSLGTWESSGGWQATFFFLEPAPSNPGWSDWAASCPEIAAQGSIEGHHRSPPAPFWMVFQRCQGPTVGALTKSRPPCGGSGQRGFSQAPAKIFSGDPAATTKARRAVVAQKPSAKGAWFSSVRGLSGRLPPLTVTEIAKFKPHPSAASRTMPQATGFFAY